MRQRYQQHVRDFLILKHQAHEMYTECTQNVDRGLHNAHSNINSIKHTSCSMRIVFVTTFSRERLINRDYVHSVSKYIMLKYFV